MLRCSCIKWVQLSLPHECLGFQRLRTEVDSQNPRSSSDKGAATDLPLQPGTAPSTAHTGHQQPEHVVETNVGEEINCNMKSNDEAMQCQAWEISCLPHRSRKHEFEKYWDAARTLAKSYLRPRPTLPRDVGDLNSGERLPPVCCAFQNCTWTAENAHTAHQYARE